MPANVPPRPPARPAPPVAKAPPRGPKPASTPGIHKLAGWLLLAQGLLTCALSWKLEGGVAIGVAIFGGLQAAVGVVALMGRSATTRAALMFLGGLVALLALVMATVPVVSPRAGHAVWVPALFGILAASALFGLLASDTASPGRLAASLFSILLGWAGYGFGAYRVTPTTVDPLLQDAAAKFALPDRSFAAAELGLTLALPDGWSVLREGHKLAGTEGALVTLVGTASGGLATLKIGSDPRLGSLDWLMDRTANDIRANFASFRELERTDTRVGAVAARRMRIVRSSGGRSREATVMLWRDAQRTFELNVVMPSGPSARAEADALANGLAFRAPLEAALQKTASAFTEACPLFSETVAHRLAAQSSSDSVPSLFRRGYAEAIRGQGRLDGLAAEGLRLSMADLFGTLSEPQRERVGAYFERLRFSARSEPAEDAAVSALLCEAARRLDTTRLSRLRDYMSRAAQAGQE